MTKIKELKTYVENHREAGLTHCKTTFSLSSLDDTKLFYQIVFCLLVPAGNAKQTNKAVQKLHEIDYFNKTIDDITLYSCIRPYVQFPRQKAIRLHSFKRSAKNFIKGLRAVIRTQTDSFMLRDYLILRVKGFGYKAASHFLRNLGVQNLVIIDTHILKYRSYFMPKDKQHYEPSSPKRYLEIEKYFTEWAIKEFDMSPAHLDWFLWNFESGNDITNLEY